MRKLLKIHGNCKHYNFKQSEPSTDGYCIEKKSYLTPVDTGCEFFKETRK